jgi:hypothetical protein
VGVQGKWILFLDSPSTRSMASNTSSLEQHEQHPHIYNMGNRNNVSNLTIKYIVEYIIESGRREKRERAEAYNRLHCI